MNKILDAVKNGFNGCYLSYGTRLKIVAVSLWIALTLTLVSIQQGLDVCLFLL